MGAAKPSTQPMGSRWAPRRIRVPAVAAVHWPADASHRAHAAAVAIPLQEHVLHVPGLQGRGFRSSSACDACQQQLASAHQWWVEAAGRASCAVCPPPSPRQADQAAQASPQPELSPGDPGGLSPRLGFPLPACPATDGQHAAAAAAPLQACPVQRAAGTPAPTKQRRPRPPPQSTWMTCLVGARPRLPPAAASQPQPGQCRWPMTTPSQLSTLSTGWRLWWQRRLRHPRRTLSLPGALMGATPVSPADPAATQHARPPLGRMLTQPAGGN
jgi:hypothetical protein